MPDAEFPNVLPRLLAAPIPARLEGMLERLLGLRSLEKLYASLRQMSGSLPLRLLEELEVTHRVAAKDLDQIPRKGPCVVVANHPFGILEGAVLAALISQRRSDFKFLANGVLAAIPQMREMVIPVEVMGGAASRNGSGLRRAIEHLAGGGLLIVFPAGEVSHFDWKSRTVTDPEWNKGVVRLVAAASRRAGGVQVVPVHIEGSNGLAFQAAGMVHPRLRTALLPRQLLNKRRAHVEVRVGAPIPAAKLAELNGDEECIRYLRWRTYLLAARENYKPRTRLPLISWRKAAAPEAVADGVVAEVLEQEVKRLPGEARLAVSGDLSAYLAPASAIPGVLREIGRLREATFRAVGEGTGKATDLDRFDQHYLHLFLWNEARREVVGAYRLCPVDAALRVFGIDGLYTATLFDYGADFLGRLGPALELGRSFVRAEYQRGFAPLLLLWRGIGKYLARNPRYKTLFGPVSISNQYQAISREMMVSFLERRASLKEWVGLVQSRNPFRSTGAGRAFLPQRGLDVDDLSDAVSDIEPGRSGIPVLLRQYLKLGGKLLGFNVDRQFASALDGLILVDLTKTEPKLLERYLGKAETAEFLRFQKGTHGT